MEGHSPGDAKANPARALPFHWDQVARPYREHATFEVHV